MTVLLYSDASYVKGESSWSAVAVRDGKLIGWTYGVFKDQTHITSSTHAEICSVVNGMKWAQRMGYVEDGEAVQVRNDNANAIGHMAGTIKSNKGKRRFARYVVEGQRLMAAGPGAFEFIWTAGHKPIGHDGDHSRFNRLCDKLATKARKHRRDVRHARAIRDATDVVKRVMNAR